MTRYDLVADELADLLSGEPAYRLRQLKEGLYSELTEPGELTTLPRSLRARLAADPRLEPAFAMTREERADGGQTIKWLLEGSGGAPVETVLMAYPKRTTVCVSSQAGCAMACSFCATGQLGYSRQLTTGEIVEQVVLAARTARDEGFGRLTNVVFMGMGEPLANYGNVFSAIRRCHDDLGLGARSFTVSTVGIVPGIARMSKESLPVNLALSLHAARDELRDELVPVNRRYPLASLAEVCRLYLERTGRRLSLEWALIDGTNDTDRDALELAGFARPLRAHVNLIPLNPTPGFLVAGSPRRRIREFRHLLSSEGVNATIRDTRGREANAACGQLAAGLEPGTLSRRLPRTTRGSLAAPPATA